MMCCTLDAYTDTSVDAMDVLAHIPLQMHLQGVSTLLWTTNAKLVGCVYLCASICYGISGLLLSWVMRGELAGLGEQLLFGDHQLYNTLTTSGVVLCIHDGVL